MKSRIAAAVTAIVVGFTAVTTATAAPIFDPQDPFYLQPVPAGAAPGELIATAPIDPTAHKILYTSTDVHGQPVPVSGTVYEPFGAWNGALLALAPGTQGQGDACAPSRDPVLSVDGATPAVGTNYEIPAVLAARGRGYRVVVTDYVGLGTPSVHGYLVRDEEGMALIDAARAATGTTGTPVVFYGYSQGGGAAAIAAEKAATYAPELNLVATYAGAIPANLLDTSESVDNSLLTGVLGYGFNAYYDRYPQIRPTVDELLNARGHEFLDTTRTGCIADTIVRWAFTDTRTLTTNGWSLHEVMTNIPEFRAIAEANNVGHGTPSRPILIATSRGDDSIPPAQVYDLARGYCARGAMVDVNTNTFPQLGHKNALNHLAPIYTNITVGLDWLGERLAGVAAPNRCDSI
ncbi:MAG: alpha/beta fold hydrolase [Corynebacterium sp.]|nr:alpha/beta fold hydrolase [Corynebacterium sp.]